MYIYGRMCIGHKQSYIQILKCPPEILCKMLRKFPKKVNPWQRAKSIAKPLILLEGVVVLIGFNEFRKMNRSSEYRLKMYQSFPFFLKAFYSTVKICGDSTMEKNDYERWKDSGIEVPNSSV